MDLIHILKLLLILDPIEVTAYILKIKYIATLEIQEVPTSRTGQLEVSRTRKAETNRSIMRQQSWEIGIEAKEVPPKRISPGGLQANLSLEAVRTSSLSSLQTAGWRSESGPTVQPNFYFWIKAQVQSCKLKILTWETQKPQITNYWGATMEIPFYNTIIGNNS